MKFITFLKKQMALAYVVGVLLSFTSCGSFQYSGIYDDGIYADSNPTEQVQETVDNTSTSSDYYKNYFKEKSLQLEDENTVFTDVDSYEGTYEDDSVEVDNYAGWGENNSSEVIINVYDNGPYYGNGWGYNYRNNWGWNLGWNNWGYSFWQPNYYNSWYNPYCYYGCNNYGYNNYGYNNYGYNNYRGRSYSYINGQRRGRYRNSSLSSRSILSATTRSAAVTRANTRSATRSRVNSRSNTRTTTRSRATTRPNTRSITRTRTTTRPTTKSTRSNSTTRPTTRPTNRTTRPNTTQINALFDTFEHTLDNKIKIKLHNTKQQK